MSENGIFLLIMAIHYAYLGIILWSIIFPEKRIWPPLQKWTWKYIVSWGLFLSAFVSNIIMMLTDKSRLLPIGNERYYLGIPLITVGLLFLVWGVQALGVKSSSGVAGEFITTGPYKFTRNPQYIGDIFLFMGIIVISNSPHVFVGLSLLILSLILMPLAEEHWLEEAFGDTYIRYKKTTPRFL